MPETAPLRKGNPAVGPTQLDQALAQLGEIKGLLYKQVVPAIVKNQLELTAIRQLIPASSTPDGLHTLFMAGTDESQVSSSAAQENAILEALVQLGVKLDHIQASIESTQSKKRPKRVDEPASGTEDNK